MRLARCVVAVEEALMIFTGLSPLLVILPNTPVMPASLAGFHPGPLNF